MTGVVTVSIEPISVTVPVAVRITGVTRTKLYEAVRAGKVATYKVGRSRLIDVKSLREFMNNNLAAPPREPLRRPHRLKPRANTEVRP